MSDPKPSNQYFGPGLIPPVFTLPWYKTVPLLVVANLIAIPLLPLALPFFVGIKVYEAAKNLREEIKIDSLKN